MWIWIFIVIAFLIASVLGYISYRLFFDVHESILGDDVTGTDAKLNLKLEIGKASMTAAGSLIILGGLIVTIGQQMDSKKQLEINLARFEQQINEKKENQKIDRFDKGIDLLSSNEKASRIGGILILENLALIDASNYHKPCVEILTGFVNNSSLENHNKSLKVNGVLLSPEIVSGIIALNNLAPISMVPEYDYRVHDLNGIHLKGVKFSNYEQLRLKRFNFTNSDISYSNFSFVKCDSIDFSNSNLVESYFQNAKVKYCNFENSNFKNSNLSNSKLEYTNLKKTDFSNSILSLVSFKNSNLENANLSNCRMLLVNLENANLRGANLKGASDITQPALDNALGNDKTIIPNYLNFPNSWKKK